MFTSDDLTQHSHEPTTVLVVDDDPITRQLLKRFLEGKGNDVLVAKDGEQAWSLFVANRPRMVITDWRMPKLDGPGLCKRIRSSQSDEYTFVLILTSNADKDAKVQGFAAGADEFMIKPFDRAELTWRIHSSLRVIGLHSSLEERIRELDEAQKRLELANKEMSDGLQAASNTQRALLPAVAPDVANTDCAWFYQPSDHLGGDSLNIFRLDEHRLGFFIADVCGHGLPSALLAVSLHRVLTPVLGQPGLLLAGREDECPIEFFSDPGRVLTEVNRRFPMSIERGEYCTAVYCVIDTLSGELRCAGAGHPHPVLLSDHEQDCQLNTDGFPIGFDDETEYETQVLKLHAGDRLWIYSDGICEAAAPDGEMFGRERLIEQLQNTKSLCVDDSVKALSERIDEWVADPRQQDDISIISAEFLGCVPASMNDSEESFSI